MAQRTKLHLVALALLGCAVTAVYGPSLSAPFVLDDDISVGGNSSIVNLWPLVGDSEYPGPLNALPNYPTAGRPLVNYSLALNYHFGKLNPIGYHIFNMAVHVLSAMLLMAVAQRILCLDYFGERFARVSGPLSFAVALLWALHPLQTETVIYVTQRTESLMCLFYLATLYCALRYWGTTSRKDQAGWIVLSTLACLAGMASKESMVTAPAVILLFERTFIAGSFRRAVWKSWPLYAGLALGWGFLLYLNYSAPRSDTVGFHLGVPAFVWWLTQTKVLWMYLKLTVWPWPLVIHYGMPYVDTLSAGLPWLLPVALLGLGTLVLLWRHNAVGFVGAWVFMTLSPTLVVPIVSEVAAERRMYLPLAGLLMLLVVGGYMLAQYAARWLSAHMRRPVGGRQALAITVVFAGVLALVWSLVDLRRLATYHDLLTLWQDALVNQPTDPLIHYYLGLALATAGRFDEVIEQNKETLRLNPNYWEAYTSMGNALASLGRMDEAIEKYQSALRLKPTYPEAHSNLGVALYKQGKIKEAIAQYQEALKLKPSYAEARFNLSDALFKSNQLQAAVEQYNLTLRYKPDYYKARLNLGVILANLGRMSEAVEQFEQTLKIKPDCLDAYANLTTIYTQLQQPEKAIAAAQQALELARSQDNTALAQQIQSWLVQQSAQRTNQPEASVHAGATRALP
jgi:protein O-mannosyl-transferase